MTKLSDEQLNKRIHEIMGMGLCWHVRSTNQCIKCHKILIRSIGNSAFECEPANPNYLTWQGFGLMWEFMQTHGWKEFIYWVYTGNRNATKDTHFIPQMHILIRLISPRPFAEAMCNFFQEDSLLC